jgi:hypothetical protein
LPTHLFSCLSFFNPSVLDRYPLSLVQFEPPLSSRIVETHIVFSIQLSSSLQESFPLLLFFLIYKLDSSYHKDKLEWVDHSSFVFIWPSISESQSCPRATYIVLFAVCLTDLGGATTKEVNLMKLPLCQQRKCPQLQSLSSSSSLLLEPALTVAGGDVTDLSSKSSNY